MKLRTNSVRILMAVVLSAVVLLSSCSRKGVHMSKHRKSRKCNCPTFAENHSVIDNSSAVFYDQRGTE